MELRLLQMFVTVAETRSFTRAAQRLRVTQSSVSTAVRTLESELGVDLLLRTTHRVDLTTAGQTLLCRAQAALDAAAAVSETAASLRGGVVGTVRIGLEPGVLRPEILDVPALFAGFRRRFPDVHLTVQRAGTAAHAARLATGDLDVAIVCLPPHRAVGARLETLSREPAVLVCSPRHPLAARACVALRELAGLEFADVPADWGIRTLADETLNAAAVHRRVLFEIDDVAGLLAFVRVSEAVAIVPMSAAHGVPGLATVPLTNGPTLVTSLATRASARRDAVVRQFLDLARAAVVDRPVLAAAASG